MDDFEFVNKGGTILTWVLNHPRLVSQSSLSKTLFKNFAGAIILILVHNNLSISFLP